MCDCFVIIGIGDYLILEIRQIFARLVTIFFEGCQTKPAFLQISVYITTKISGGFWRRKMNTKESITKRRISGKNS